MLRKHIPVSVPNLNTSNVTNISYLFYGCEKLITFPEIDTSKVEHMYLFINDCTSLKSVPALNASKMVYGLNFSYDELPNLTEFGGLIGLKTNMNDNFAFVKTPNLTYESCINILNGLYDFTGNGEKPASLQGKLKVHRNFLTTVGSEISIGTNKGWTISA